MRVAIIRLSSLGDIIITSVFLEFLKRNIDSIHITWIVDANFAGILKDSQFIDDICEVNLRDSKNNKSILIDIYKKLKLLQPFDLVLDFQGLLKSAIIGKLLKTKIFVGYSYNSAREHLASLFYTKKVYIPYDEHILKRNFQIIKIAFNLDSNFNLSLLDYRCKIFNATNNSLISDINFIHTNVLFIIEASKVEKQYPIESFYKLALELKKIGIKQIYLIWDKQKQEIENLSNRNDIFYLLPYLDFNSIKALLLNIDLVIGGDTGITHLAWAMCIKSITLYGNTPINRFNLMGDKHISICSVNHNKIIKGDFSIVNINPLDVAKAAQKLINLV